LGSARGIFAVRCAPWIEDNFTPWTTGSICEPPPEIPPARGADGWVFLQAHGGRYVDTESDVEVLKGEEGEIAGTLTLLVRQLQEAPSLRTGFFTMQSEGSCQ